MRVRRGVVALRVLGALGLGVILSAHVGSPDVFFSGMAGAYDIKVVVRPPDVVPGIARVTVQVPAGVTGVTIRPVFWRAGSKGSPSADPMRRLGETSTYAGSLWLMASGAYSVDVSVSGAQGTANVLVPVASVATGRLVMNPALGAMLALVGVFLVVGLVNIVRKSAGEALVEPGRSLDNAGTTTSRIAGGVAFVVLVTAILGGARWWRAVDRDYQSTMYRPGALALSLTNGVLRLAAGDTLYLPQGRASTYVPDHGKLMHLFLIKSGDASAFAHLHPAPDSAEIPAFTAALPSLPAGDYNVFADVVQETGFERTMVGRLTVPAASAPRVPKRDPDDSWFTGPASTNNSARLADGSTMTLALDPATPPSVGAELMLNVRVIDAAGKPAALEQYLGMPAHAVVARLDGSVYVHLHTMGTVTMAAQDAFLARDRGDTTATGALRPSEHAQHQAAPIAASVSSASFPYAFPKGGEYRLFVQVKRGGRVLTGAFALSVADSVVAR